MWPQDCQGIEAFLIQTQEVLPSRRGHLIGAVPFLVCGGHYAAPAQSHIERLLRRSGRRVREAQFLSCRAALVPAALVQNISTSLDPNKCNWVRLLDAHRKHTVRAKRQNWSADSAWVKQTTPPPFVLEGGVPGRVACLKKLKPVWESIFGCNNEKGECLNASWELFADDRPPSTPAAYLRPLTFQQVCKKTAATATQATGPDGISAQKFFTPRETDGRG